MKFISSSDFAILADKVKNMFQPSRIYCGSVDDSVALNDPLEVCVAIDGLTWIPYLTATTADELYRQTRHIWLTECRKDFALCCSDRLVIYHGYKPLPDREIYLRELNIKPTDVLMTKWHCGWGGAAQGVQLPTYEHIIRTEQQILSAVPVRNTTSGVADRSETRYPLRVQSDDEVFKIVLEQMKHKMTAENVNFVIKLVEDSALLGYQMWNATSLSQRAGAMLTFVKLRIDGPLLSSDRLGKLKAYFDQVFEETEVQSVESFLHSAREKLDTVDMVKESMMFQKLHRFMMYALSLSFFEKVGVTFDTLRYSKMEAESIRRKHYMGASFMHSMLDTLLFLTERGYQCMKTGSLDPIYHGESSYSDWMLTCQKLQKQSKFLSNPEPHNFSVPSFLMDLDEAIEKGKAIAKYSYRNTEIEKKIIRRALAELELIKAMEITRRAAGKDRQAPFSVLVFGGSNIAKSAFTKMLFFHFGKIFGLPTESEYRYVRNPNDRFWSGFTSAKWCVQLDDIAYMHPNAAPQGDPSVLEMLQVVNSVPFVPNQADLEDKGRTPMRAKFVVATSNSETLNAFHYFNCPLAIQRRLPFVICLMPKEEYARNEVFLNPDAAPALLDGEYPDFWDITVKMVIPQGKTIYNQQAKLEVVEKFTNVYDFIAWFSRAAKKFEQQQSKVCESDESMSKADVCMTCYKPKVADGKGCVCESPMEEQGLMHMASWSFYSFLGWCYNWTLFVSFVQLAMAIPVVNVWVSKQVACLSQRNMQRALQWLGRRYEKQIGIASMFLGMSAMIGSLVLYFKIFQSLMGSGETMKEQTNESESIGRAPQPAKEQENVWFCDDFQCTTFDAPVKAASYAQSTDQSIAEVLASNAVIFRSKVQTPEGLLMRTNRALALGGQYYLTNNHGLPSHGDIDLNVRMQPGEGIKAEHNCLLTQSEIHRYPDYDVALIKLSGWAPKKDIRGFFASEAMTGNVNGFYLLRGDDGKIETIALRACSVTQEVVGFLGNLRIWKGKSSRPTELGECGMPMVLRNSFGPFIAGIHVGGSASLVASTVLNRELITSWLEKFESPVIQPNVPVVDLPTVKRELGDLSQKSPFRFLPQGVAKVYGSFTNSFRAFQKSKVTDTLMCDAAVKRGYQIKTGAPVMRGWKPWYNAAKDMVNPVSRLDNTILSKVKHEFVHDILSRLDKDQLKTELHVYDDVTAINGMMGVKFVDKMNRNTSMGSPWKRSKKFFLKHEAALPNVPDPVSFGPEVMDRVNDCIAKYQRGERYFPVFTGALKDEAIKFSKIETQCTRIFCSSPVDWNIVVRKYLLPFIRVAQLNRFIFEAGPGTCAQSREWEEIRSFLVQHGSTRMIAGDYKAFDKRMPPQVILEAYDIIKRVCEASGNYTEIDLLVIEGIAMDVAFPIVDLNGDLVELSGSNPSGHPLTVTINGLANCLYMRYVYACLNPNGLTAVDFVQHVALMTYGDDNVMGCSATVPWFNHTAISDLLASVDIVYTMADKDAKSVPYITIDEVSFLKRSWRYDEDLDAFVCPIEEDSIAKMLTKCVPSRTISRQAQAVQVLSTVVREYFWYGKSTFESKRAMCIEIMHECELEDWQEESTFPTWDDLKDSFNASSQSRL
jgi:hypothetical protein